MITTTTFSIRPSLMLETRTRFKEDCDWSRLDLNLDQILQVGNQDSLQRGLRLAEQPTTLSSSLLLETRTRFKEDCDRGTWSSRCGRALISWKPGLASKRIATEAAQLACPSPATSRLETRTRFKEDCDEAQQGRSPTELLPVGNQDSLQRGLRRISSSPAPSGPLWSLETRTRFKEDCDPISFPT